MFLTKTSLVCSINACHTKHHIKDQKYYGEKNSKVRLTRMIPGNAIGEKHYVLSYFTSVCHR